MKRWFYSNTSVWRFNKKYLKRRKKTIDAKKKIDQISIKYEAKKIKNTLFVKEKKLLTVSNLCQFGKFSNCIYDEDSTMRRESFWLIFFSRQSGLRRSFVERRSFFNEESAERKTIISSFLWETNYTRKAMTCSELQFWTNASKSFFSNNQARIRNSREKKAHSHTSILSAINWSHSCAQWLDTPSTKKRRRRKLS